MDVPDWLFVMLVAGGLGAVIGIEREVGGHAAGIRTQALVAMAAALVTAVGAEFRGPGADPTRIAAQVLSGIGFIGAGVILKHGFSVRGLTTAATLWMTSAVGIAVGAGLTIPALIATGITVAISLGLGMLKPLLSRHLQRTLEVEYQHGYGTLGPLIRELQQLSIDILDITIDDEATPDGVRRVTVRLSGRDISELDDLVALLESREEVLTARVRDG